VLYLRVLVTGSTGQLGSALLNQLKGSDYKVKITSRRKPERMGHFEWVYSDLLSGGGLEEAVKDVDVIIHAATSLSMDHLSLPKIVQRILYLSFVFAKICSIVSLRLSVPKMFGFLTIFDRKAEAPFGRTN